MVGDRFEDLRAYELVALEFADALVEGLSEVLGSAVVDNSQEFLSFFQQALEEVCFLLLVQDKYPSFEDYV